MTTSTSTSAAPARDAIGTVRTRPSMVGRVAGVVGAGASLGLAELFAGLSAGVPSLVDAVAAQVVPILPGGLVTWAIETLGASDRLVIGVTIAAVVLGLGAVAGGMLERGRDAEAATMFAGFGLVGVVAATADIATDLVTTVVAVVAASVLGFLLARFLVRGRAANRASSRVPTGAGAARSRIDEPATTTDDASSAGSTPATAPATTMDVTRTDGRTVVGLDRRRFLAAAGTVGVGAVAAGAAGRMLGRPPAVAPAAAAVAENLPTPTSTLPPAPAAASLDVPGLTPLFVPNDDFYRIDTALTGPPAVDVTTWRLRIHGMVGEERSFGFEELLDRGLVESDVTIACVSNKVGGGLVGNARWTGIPLAPLLDEVGVLDGGTQLVGRSVDGFTVGFPTDIARDGRDAMIAVAMNGDPLPVAHGFPARLIVPGLYGYVSATKWLSDIELTGWDDFDAYWIRRTWSKEGPIKTQSRIDAVGSGQVTAGVTSVAGVAWAPTRGIEQVEVRLDDGPWQDAMLSQPLNDTTWVQWQADVDLPAGDHTVTVRATDGTGTIQPEPHKPEHPDGAEGWHQVRVGVA